MIPFPLPVYSDSQFDPDVWDSLVHSNLDLHIAATFTTLDGPTIIFPFTSSEENGGGSINDNSNDNNIDDNNNADSNKQSHEKAGFILRRSLDFETHHSNTVLNFNI